MRSSADVAKSLSYAIGEKIVVAHGSGEVGFALHSEHPFHVVGILARTGTPVDRTIHISLEGFGALHEDDNAVSQDPLAAARDAAIAKRHADASHREDDEHGRDAAKTISAFLIGLKSRGAALSLQRQINQFPEEPLTAILPGVTLLEVWGIVSAAESALLLVSSLVLVVGLAGMLVALLTSLSERRREMAVLRSVGARPLHVFALILGEAAFLTLLGIALGIAALYAGEPWLESRLGLFIEVGMPSPRELGLIIAIGIAGALIGLIPAYRIYRYSLADGMMIRV
ncbi:MAG TPA: ABC transporter permease [Casimicrobiaceae bacterium]|nr:ABC transporter permease [Casimicrobiaceae bacterium]